MTCTGGIFKRILIKCPASYNDYIGVPDNYFAVAQGTNFLRIMVQPSEYTRIREKTPPPLQRFYSGATKQIDISNIGFTVSMRESDERVRYLLEKISRLSLVTASTPGSQYKPIEIWDYVRPDLEDYEAAVKYKQTSGADTEPFTRRYGEIVVEPGSGLQGTNTALYGDGNLRFTFNDVRGSII